jgi:hypothetical protein
MFATKPWWSLEKVSSVSMDMIENRTFDEINVGESASLVRKLSREDYRTLRCYVG